MCTIWSGELRIQLINPNTTEAMTLRMAASARLVAATGTEIVAATSRSGPPSIEGHYDEAMSIAGMIDEIRRGSACDAHVIACFGDPGLMAAREFATAPVIGIAEAAMKTATLVATGFSVVTTLSRTRIIAEHLVSLYGFERHCRRVRATDIPVLDLERDDLDIHRIVGAECARALEEDGSGAIVLGCAGMADLAARLTRELGAPVIDGVAAAVKLAEGLVAMEISTSRRGDLAHPLPKIYSGQAAAHSPGAYPGQAKSVRRPDAR